MSNLSRSNNIPSSGPHACQHTHLFPKEQEWQVWVVRHLQDTHKPSQLDTCLHVLWSIHGVDKDVAGVDKDVAGVDKEVAGVDKKVAVWSSSVLAVSDSHAGMRKACRKADRHRINRLCTHTVSCNALHKCCSAFPMMHTHGLERTFWAKYLLTEPS